MVGRRLLLAVAATLALAIAFTVGFEWRSTAYTPPPPPRPVAPESVRSQVVDDLETLYYKRVPAATLRLGTVQAILNALHDPYTTYLSKNLYRSVMASEQGGYTGFGLALEGSQRGLLVTRVMPGMPGGEAGIRPGDVITSVNGTSVATVSVVRALDLISTSQTRVHLVVVRQSGARQAVTLVPRVIPEPVAIRRQYVFDHQRYEYLRLLGFPSDVAAIVRRDAELAVRDHDRGVVLDLRGNPGGLLDQAVDVVRVFVNQGPIVSIYGLHEPRQFYAADGSAVSGLKLAVLVDRSTASAAEVVAGALHHFGAALVGTRTFGKGTVQSIERLSNGSGLKLTVARFVLPGNLVIEGHGLHPNIAVARAGERRWASLLAALKALAA